MISVRSVRVGVTDKSIRCARCQKLLAESATRPWHIRCVRCGHANSKKPCHPVDEPRPEPSPVRKPEPEVAQTKPETAQKPKRTVRRRRRLA